MQLVKQLNTINKGLPEALKLRNHDPETGVWVYASREIIDEEGDLIMIDGINLAAFSNPAEGTRIKALAQHVRTNADGTPAIVGLVTDALKTETLYRGQSVKTLALWIEWLTRQVPVMDDEGKPMMDDQGQPMMRRELMPLSQIYKDFVDAGGIDQVSIGVGVTDYEQMESGGYRIHACDLQEVSFVTLAANQSATIVKALEDKLGEQLEKAKIEPPQPRLRPHPLANQLEKMAKQLDELAKHVKEPDGHTSLVEGHLKSLGETLVRIQERLDALESAAVILTQAATSGEDHRSEEVTKGLQTALGLLTDLNKRMAR